MRTHYARKARQAETIEKIEDGSIDAGLLVLLAETPPGIELSAEEIAFVCGCSRACIWQIENRAMKKLRRLGVLKRLKEALIQ